MLPTERRTEASVLKASQAHRPDPQIHDARDAVRVDPVRVSEIGVIAGGQVGVAILALVAVRVTTEILDPRVYGAVALILAGFSLSKGLFVAPWLAAQLRLHPEANAKGELGSLYQSLAWLCAAGVFVASISVTSALGFVPNLMGGWSFGLLAVSALWLASDGAIGIALNYLNAEVRQGPLSVIRLLDAFLRPGLAIVAVVLVGSSALLFVAGQAGGAIILVLGFGIIGLRSLRRRERTSLGPAGSGRWGAEMLRYGAPLVPIVTIQWVIHLSDRYILQFYHGTAEVGFYSAAYGLASHPFLMLSGVTTLILRPRLFRVAQGDIPAALAYRRMWLSGIVVLGGIGFVVLSLLRDSVGRLLLAAEYRLATPLIPIIAAAYFVLVVGQGLENWLLAEKRTRIVLIAGLASMVASLGSALLFIPRFGSEGAAWATLIGLVTYTGALGVEQQIARKRRVW